MSIKGYVDYKRREYCKDVKCPIQIKLDKEAQGSKAYTSVRETCVTGCKHTTYQFHHWLIEKEYLVVRSAPQKVK